MPGASAAPLIEAIEDTFELIAAGQAVADSPRHTSPPQAGPSVSTLAVRLMG
jgi:hypothetical protein